MRAGAVPSSVRALLWVAILHAAVWVVIGLRPVAAQSDLYRRVGQLEDRQSKVVEQQTALLVDATDLRALVRQQSLMIENQAKAIDAVVKQMDRVKELMIGVLLSVVVGLVSVLWSLRKAWLIPKPSTILEARE